VVVGLLLAPDHLRIHRHPVGAPGHYQQDDLQAEQIGAQRLLAPLLGQGIFRPLADAVKEGAGMLKDVTSLIRSLDLGMIVAP